MAYFMKHLTVILLLTCVATATVLADKMAGRQDQMGPGPDMMQHMQMMKSKLNLSAEQEPLFNRFSSAKQAMMKDMLACSGGMMQQVGGGRTTYSEQGMKCSMMEMSFAEQMKMLIHHAEQMNETSVSGMSFYNSLRPEQKQAFENIQKEMKQMMLKQMKGMMK